MTTPESKEKCCEHCLKPGHISLCIDRHCHCHQRPESGWLEEFRANITYGVNAPWAIDYIDEIAPDIEAFIARHIAAAYQRGQEDADTRLLKNNTDLQAKLREGNRAILDELEKLWSHKAWHEISCPAHSNQMRPEHECDCVFSLMPELIQYLLSFQQEPQDL